MGKRKLSSIGFRREKAKMSIEEYLALEAPDRYDFSNDGASEAYNIDNIKMPKIGAKKQETFS